MRHQGECTDYFGSCRPVVTKSEVVAKTGFDAVIRIDLPSQEADLSISSKGIRNRNGCTALPLNCVSPSPEEGLQESRACLGVCRNVFCNLTVDAYVQLVNGAAMFRTDETIVPLEICVKGPAAAGANARVAAVAAMALRIMLLKDSARKD